MEKSILLEYQAFVELFNSIFYIKIEFVLNCCFCCFSGLLFVFFPWLNPYHKKLVLAWTCQNQIQASLESVPFSYGMHIGLCMMLYVNTLQTSNGSLSCLLMTKSSNSNISKQPVNTCWMFSRIALDCRFQGRRVCLIVGSKEEESIHLVLYLYKVLWTLLYILPHYLILFLLV